MTNVQGAPIEVLLIEDNAGDVQLTQEALRTGKVRTNLHVAGDGVEALAFLRNEGEHAGALQPDLILLDLNLPTMSGREVLAQIKLDDRLCRIPVVVLTASPAERDIFESYRLRANAYVVKPIEAEQFLEVIGSIQEFWLEIVKLSHP